MRSFRFVASCALLGATVSVQPAQAVVYGVKSVVITNPLDTWLQIAEFEAYNIASVNVAAAANGAGVTNVGGVWSTTSGPGNAIDGNEGGDFALDGIFHPQVEQGTSLTVTFASVETLAGLAIFGRTDSSQDRNYYRFQLLDENGALILPAFVLDATGGTYSQAIAFMTDEGTPPAAPVPEPATWAMMIAGMGWIGAEMRRLRKAAARRT